MLRFLRIARLAVIDAVEVEFDPGLNVLTGETGAGKSILVEAVGLLLGGRASADLVRTGEDVASVEAIFQRGGDDELVVRREVTAQGRSRAFVNGALVPAATLKELAGGLLELHGQHEHHTLLDPGTHLAALDAYAQLDDARHRTAAAYEAWRTAVDADAAWRAAARERAARLELSAFQLQEIDRVAPKPGEDQELAATRAALANAARLQQLCRESYAALYEQDGAVLGALGSVWKRVGELATLDPAFQPYLASRDTIKAQLEDLAVSLRRYVDDVDVSSGRLQHVDERLAMLERLKRKHGPTLDRVLARQAALRLDVADADAAEAHVATSARALAALRTAFLTEAEALSARRRDAARAFVPELLRLLAGLALEGAQFEIRFNPTPLPEADWGPLGIDRAEFLVSMNPGEDRRPLARIVSGGELSRVMLALKTMTFRARLGTDILPSHRTPGIAAPGMIFDEVDAGIGGRVAEVVGRRLRALGAAFQVLCITHLPQVAAHADTHYLIDKTVTGGRTHTRVARLTADQRVEELSRMLAGSAVTDTVRASARELLGRAMHLGPGAKGEPKSKGESESAPARSRKERHGA